MNKYQEALNIIKNETCHIGEVGEPIKVIQELVDKETPMKPIDDKCSRCNRKVSYWVKGKQNFHMPRCSGKDCGQVIDWGNNLENTSD